MEKNYLGIDPKGISVGILHQYLLAGIAPRPIALVSTMDRSGNVNLSPFSYFNVFGANPPILIFSPARRVRDNTTKHSLENAKEYGQLVINMVDVHMAEQMSLSSTEYEKGVNEFQKAGFREMESRLVGPPTVEGAPFAFECEVKDIIETGKGGGAGNLVICEVVYIHIRKDLLDDQYMPDASRLYLVGRMGGSWYVKTDHSNMFEIPKPLKSKGIGVDALPESARNSEILTGNNLGRLGNSESLPDESELRLLEKEVMSNEKSHSGSVALLDELQRKAKILLENGEDRKALALVFLADKYYTSGEQD